MTTPIPLLRAKLAAGTVAAVTLASVLTTAPATATPVKQTHAVQQVAVSLLSETSAATTTFGVADSHLYNLGHDALVARLTELRGLGVSDLRIAVPWVYIEPAAGTYDWSKMDALVATASEMGFTLTGAVTATPTWAGFPLAGAPNPDTYAGFAGAVAARYGSQIASYEVWNEPNGVIFYAPVSAAGYTQMLKAAYTAIKAANPDAVVLAGSLGATTDVSGISVTPQRFLAQMYEAGAGGYFDALSYHPYHFTLPFSQGAGTLNTPLEQVKALYELMVANGDADKIDLGHRVRHRHHPRLGSDPSGAGRTTARFPHRVVPAAVHRTSIRVHLPGRPVRNPQPRVQFWSLHVERETEVGRPRTCRSHRPSRSRRAARLHRAAYVGRP